MRNYCRQFIPSVRTTPGYSFEGVGLPPIQLCVIAVTAAVYLAARSAGALVHLFHPFQRVSDCGSLHAGMRILTEYRFGIFHFEGELQESQKKSF